MRVDFEGENHLSEEEVASQDFLPTSLVLSYKITLNISTGNLDLLENIQAC